MRTELRRAHSRGTRSGVESPRSAVLTAATSMLGVETCAEWRMRGVEDARSGDVREAEPKLQRRILADKGPFHS